MVRTLFLLVIYCQSAYPGFALRTAGGRHAALAGADLAFPGTAWSLACNPASLVDVKQIEGTVSASPQPFGMPELASVSLALAVPTPVGVFGVGADRFGFDLYREVTYSLGYSRQFPGFEAGLAINYYSFSIAGYGSSGTIGLDGGIMIPLTSRLTFVVEGENMNSPTIGSCNDPLPQSFTLGLAWKMEDILDAEFDYRKEIQLDPAPAAGVELWPMQFLALRFGFSQVPPSVCMGFGISYSIVDFDYAYSSHQELGGTQQISITFHGGR